MNGIISYELVNPCSIIFRQRLLYTSKYLPWAIKNGRNAKPLMSVYWEEHWTDDVNELRRKLNITLDV